MGDHIAEWQAVKERESRRGFCWAEMWAEIAFLFPAPGLNSFGVRWVRLVCVSSSSPSVPFPLPTSITRALPALPAAITQLKPRCLRVVRLFFYLYCLGLGFFSPIVSSSEWKWFAVILGWGFFHMKEKEAFTLRLTRMQEEYLTGQRSAG